MADLQSVHLYNRGIQLIADNSNNLLIQISNLLNEMRTDCLQLWHPNSNNINYLFWNADTLRGEYTGDGDTGYRTIFTHEYTSVKNGVAIITCKTRNLTGIIYRGTTLLCIDGEFIVEFNQAECYASVITIKKPTYFNAEGDEYEWCLI